MRTPLRIRRRPGHARRPWAFALAAVGAVLVSTLPSVSPAVAGRGDARPAARVVALTPARGTTVTKRFFGMHVPALADAFPQAPVGSVDFTTNNVYWPQVEPSDGTFDYTALDQLVARATSNHARPLIVLGGTPKWASTTPDVSRVWPTVPDQAAWLAYVQAVVDHVGARADYQLWPEPNVKLNWVGTPQQMADLIAPAATLIHQRAPGSTVVAPPMVLRLRYERIFMRKFFASQVDGVPIGDYVDAASVDPYPMETEAPEESLALVQHAQRILAANHVTAPLWTVEINYGVPVGGVGVAVHSGDRKQASYVARTYVLSAADDVRRVFWLGWYQYPRLDVEMVESDGVTPSAAGRAFALVAQWLTGQHARGCVVDRGDDVYSCRFVRDGRSSWALWTTGAPTHVPAPSGAGRVQKLTGERYLTSTDQRLRVTKLPVWVTS